MLKVTENKYLRLGRKEDTTTLIEIQWIFPLMDSPSSDDLLTNVQHTVTVSPAHGVNICLNLLNAEALNTI